MDNQQYVICSEVFPMETRGLGVALSLFGQFAGTALFVGVAPTSKSIDSYFDNMLMQSRFCCHWMEVLYGVCVPLHR